MRCEEKWAQRWATGSGRRDAGVLVRVLLSFVNVVSAEFRLFSNTGSGAASKYRFNGCPKLGTGFLR